MKRLLNSLNKNRSKWITLAALFILLILAIRGMETKDWVITLLRGLSVGSIIFLVASGFSIIFGLMDVLNMAHGAMFMVGAYAGWTVAVRPDTFIDLLTPFLILIAGFLLIPVWKNLLEKTKFPVSLRKIWPWVGLALTGVMLFYILPKYPITSWSVGSYETSPTNWAFAASQGAITPPEPVLFTDISVFVGIGGLILASVLAGLTIAGLMHNRDASKPGGLMTEPSKTKRPLILFGILLVLGLVFYAVNTPLTTFLLGLNNTWLYVLAIFVALFTGIGLGMAVESSIIRPLYATPVYILLLTLGLSSIIVEGVRAIWGSPEFTMPRPSIFNGTGDGCPAASLADLIEYQCSTISILGGRVRTYNEVFIPILGIIVLIVVWILLQRTRLGMIVRAGVQDSEMVEALGINVRQVFTTVFGLGVGLAALGGVVGAPSTGLTTSLGDSLFINLLVALAIGGLTSYPGAALGSLIVGLLQQFIIKYGAIGINLPFLAEPFKPSPPLVPAMTVILMVIILLVMPNGLFGRSE